MPLSTAVYAGNFIRYSLVSIMDDMAGKVGVSVKREGYTLKNTEYTVGIYFPSVPEINAHFTLSKKIGYPTHWTIAVVNNEGQIVRRKLRTSIYYNREKLILSPPHLAYAPEAYDQVAWNAVGDQYKQGLELFKEHQLKIEEGLTRFMEDTGAMQELNRILMKKKEVQQSRELQVLSFLGNLPTLVEKRSENTLISLQSKTKRGKKNTKTRKAKTQGNSSNNASSSSKPSTQLDELDQALADLGLDQAKTEDLSVVSKEKIAKSKKISLQARRTFNKDFEELFTSLLDEAQDLGKIIEDGANKGMVTNILSIDFLKKKPELINKISSRAHALYQIVFHNKIYSKEEIFNIIRRGSVDCSNTTSLSNIIRYINTVISLIKDMNLENNENHFFLSKEDILNSTLLELKNLLDFFYEINNNFESFPEDDLIDLNLSKIRIEFVWIGASYDLDGSEEVDYDLIADMVNKNFNFLLKNISSCHYKNTVVKFMGLIVSLSVQRLGNIFKEINELEPNNELKKAYEIRTSNECKTLDLLLRKAFAADEKYHFLIEENIPKNYDIKKLISLKESYSSQESNHGMGLFSPGAAMPNNDNGKNLSL